MLMGLLSSLLHSCPQSIGILHHKKAKLSKHLQQSVGAAASIRMYVCADSMYNLKSKKLTKQDC